MLCCACGETKPLQLHAGRCTLALPGAGHPSPGPPLGWLLTCLLQGCQPAWQPPAGAVHLDRGAPAAARPPGRLGRARVGGQGAAQRAGTALGPRRRTHRAAPGRLPVWHGGLRGACLTHLLPPFTQQAQIVTLMGPDARCFERIKFMPALLTAPPEVPVPHAAWLASRTVPALHRMLAWLLLACLAAPRSSPAGLLPCGPSPPPTAGPLHVLHRVGQPEA